MKLAALTATATAVVAGLVALPATHAQRVAAAPVPAAASPSALTPPVARLAATSPQRSLRVIVQQLPGQDASEAVRAAGGQVERKVDLINALSVRVTAAGAARIATAPGVRAVSVDAPIKGASVKAKASGLNAFSPLQTAYNQSIRADKAWAWGVTGRGIGVAVIDTGIRGDLPDFRVSRTDGRSRVVANAVVNPGAATADDAYGHGTHIAGLIAGNGMNRPFGDPLRGDYIGAAPGAHLIGIKAGDEHGDSTVLDVIDGLQFAVDHKAQLGIRVVNLSLSSRVAESYLTDPLDAAAEAAWMSGIVVVTAAGNRGEDLDAVSYAPGNDPFVISVGGVDDQGTGNVRDDAIADWSSRGTTQDGFAKPDVLAPGAHLVSTMGPNAEYRTLCPTCIVDGDYFRVGGTSMAAAVASGAIADILQVHPRWTPDQVKQALLKRTRAVRDDDQGTDVVGADGDEQPDEVNLQSTIVGGEIAIDKVLGYYNRRTPSRANRGIALNSLLNTATGALDYTRTSWTRTSWTKAIDILRTSWTQADYMRTSWTRTSWTATEETCAEFERTSWTRASWTAAEINVAQTACDTLLAVVDPTRTSWTRTSWTRTSWTSSFTK